jgi:YVTN family beta-propeller protein
MSELPTGTVTFLFTDIEGSTRLVARLRDRYRDVLAQHQQLLRAAFADAHGQEIDTQGDSFFVAFPRARDAVAAAVAAQRGLAESSWPEGVEVRVRMGLHAGEPSLGGERYVGLDVHRAARIAAAAHGGQVLVSSLTRGLIEDELPDAVSLRDLGEHRLKDLERPERLSQLVIEGLPNDFPPPLTAGAVPLELASRAQELGEAAVEAVSSGRKRRRWAMAALGVVVAAGGIAGTLLALTGGGGKPVPASANALALIDSNGKRVNRYLRLGSSPSNVTTGDGAVWVLDGDDLTISKVDPKTRAISRTFSSGQIPTDLAVGNGAIWVGNGVSTSGSEQVGKVFAASVSRISDQGNTVRTRLPGPRSLSFAKFAFRIPGVAQLAAGRSGVWAINPDGSVSEFDARTGKVAGVARGLMANAIAVGDLGVWAIDNSNALVRIDSRTREVKTRVTPAVSSLIGIAVGAGSVWATDPFDGTVWRVTLEPQPVTRTVSVGLGVTGIAVGDGQVWVSNFFDGTVSQIDPHSDAVVKTVPVRGTPRALAVGGGATWLTVSHSDVSACPLSYRGKGMPDFVVASDLPLHGPVGTLTGQMSAGIRLLFEQRGYRAGKYSVGYRSCDDSTAQGGAFDLYKCAANAHAYAEDSSVIGVVGTYHSACAANEVTIMNRARPGPVTMISPANTDPSLTHRTPELPASYLRGLYPSGTRNFARVVSSDDYLGAAAAVLADELGLRRIAVLATSASATASLRPSLLASFRRAARRLGLRIVGPAHWNEQAPNYRALARAVATSRAEGIFIADANLNGEQLIRDLRARLGRKVEIFLNDTWLPFQPMIEKAGPAATGVYVPFYAAANDVLTPAGKRFMRQLRTREGTPLESFGAAQAAQAAAVLLDAIARSDGTRASVNAAVRSARIANGILGTFRFDANGDIMPAAITIFRIVGGSRRSATNLPDFDGSVVDRVLSVPAALLWP